MSTVFFTKANMYESPAIRFNLCILGSKVFDSCFFPFGTSFSRQIGVHGCEKLMILRDFAAIFFKIEIMDGHNTL